MKFSRRPARIPDHISRGRERYRPAHRACLPGSDMRISIDHTTRYTYACARAVYARSICASSAQHRPAAGDQLEAGVRESTARLLLDIDGLTDDAVRGDSLLPGWSIGPRAEPPGPQRGRLRRSARRGTAPRAAADVSQRAVPGRRHRGGLRAAAGAPGRGMCGTPRSGWTRCGLAMRPDGTWDAPIRYGSGLSRRGRGHRALARGGDPTAST